VTASSHSLAAPLGPLPITLGPFEDAGEEASCAQTGIPVQLVQTLAVNGRMVGKLPYGLPRRGAKRTVIFQGRMADPTRKPTGYASSVKL